LVSRDIQKLQSLGFNPDLSEICSRYPPVIILFNTNVFLTKASRPSNFIVKAGTEGLRLSRLLLEVLDAFSKSRTDVHEVSI